MNGLAITLAVLGFGVFIYFMVKKGKKKAVSTAPKKKTGRTVSEGFSEKPEENMK